MPFLDLIPSFGRLKALAADPHRGTAKIG